MPPRPTSSRSCSAGAPTLALDPSPAGGCAVLLQSGSALEKLGRVWLKSRRVTSWARGRSPSSHRRFSAVLAVSRRLACLRAQTCGAGPHSVHRARFCSRVPISSSLSGCPCLCPLVNPCSRSNARSSCFLSACMRVQGNPSPPSGTSYRTMAGAAVFACAPGWLCVSCPACPFSLASAAFDVGITKHSFWAALFF